MPFFFCLVQFDLTSGVFHAFFSRRQEKKVPFYNQYFFVISPVRSNPFPQFFTGSFAVDFGITCGRGSFAVHFGDHLRSRDHLRLGITCGTVQQSVCEKLLNQSVKEKGYFLNRNCKVSNLKMLLVSRFFSAECGSRDSIGN